MISLKVHSSLFCAYSGFSLFTYKSVHQKNYRTQVSKCKRIIKCLKWYTLIIIRLGHRYNNSAISSRAEAFLTCLFTFYKAVPIHDTKKDGGCLFYHNPSWTEPPSVRCDTSKNHLKRKNLFTGVLSTTFRLKCAFSIKL